MKVIVSDEVNDTLNQWEKRGGKFQKWARIVRDSFDVISIDPSSSDYERSYLGDDRQIHPSGESQLTVYFEVIASQQVSPFDPVEDVVFIKWVNDENCLHNTFTSHYDSEMPKRDPCTKEFLKRKQNSDLPKFKSEHYIGEYKRHFEFGNDFLSFTFKKTSGFAQAHANLEKTGHNSYNSDGVRLNHGDLKIAENLLQLIVSDFKVNNASLRISISTYEADELVFHEKHCPQYGFVRSTEDEYVHFDLK